MQSVFCGVDFGTTNTSVALSDGKNARAIPLDPLNDSPTSLPSLLYMSREGEKIVGRQAADAFIQRNVDREVKLKQVDLGVSVEAYVGGTRQKDSFNPALIQDTNVRHAMRAKATLEINSPGRLFQSLKTLLRQPAFKDTEVFGTKYQIEELVSYILSPVKQQVDSVAGFPVEKAVFGRPVLFSEDESENRLAEERLRTAANLVGFKDVVFFYEPVGASVEYAVELQKDNVSMVVDIGGGTCDVCIMEFQGGDSVA